MSKEFQQIMIDISTWSDATFGNGQRTVPILYHLKKEVKEVIEALEQNKSLGKIETEFADCFMLLFDAAYHFGFTAEKVLHSMRNKLEINKQRDWGKPDKNGVIEHSKEEYK